MAESASAEGSCPGRPVRGILKKPASTPKTMVMDSEAPGGIRWDEINIMMTEHPEGKDYGHMKISEPKTPYHERMSGDEDDEEASHGVLCADALAEKVLEAKENAPTKRWGDGDSSGSECSDDEELSEEAKEHKKKFKEWRKKHYNEYQAVQRARALIQQDEEFEQQPEQMQF